MSESILKALMQLFAIIAWPEEKGSLGDRRAIVESFLKLQINRDLVDEYLKIFDTFYDLYQLKLSEKSKSVKRASSSSVRLLKICTEINNQLTQQQKVVVLVRLLEFARSESGTVSNQEMAFIATVAETFHIEDTEFNSILNYALLSFDKIEHTEDILTISNEPEDYSGFGKKHIFSDNFRGEVKILSILSANMFFIRYHGKHELYLNGHLLLPDRIFVLNAGASIRNAKINAIYYSDILSRFTLDKVKERITFEAKEVEYKFRGGQFGLHSLSFSEESGKLIGIMGASGAGKSTLLNVLNGSDAPTSGEVQINGISIHKEKEATKGLIGFVSQDDLLMEDLSVFQNLYYNAKLCFSNYSENDIVETVDRTLINLGLFDIKHMRVGSPLNKKISGGQRKRLNIALELIREPTILFLDEPTSGLSSRDSENILDLLKELTLKGKLVFVVIHQPSSDIFKMFDKLLILDTGGYLIYNGDPIESIIYFKSRIQHANWNESECATCGNVNPEQIFNIVEANVLDEYGNSTRVRKTSPKEWNYYYDEFSAKENSTTTVYADMPEKQFKIPNRLKQLWVFISRDLLSKFANKQYWVINLVEPPLLAFILSYIIKFYNVDVNNKIGYTLADNSNLPVYIFMSVIVAIFIGLTVSAEEIIKDQKILKRESFLNLSRASYLLSKVAILIGISAIQAFLFVIVGNTIMEVQGMYFAYWIVLFSAWVSANMLGLLISDSFKTVVTIYILIPFLVIPQIILSGIIVKYEKLNPNISSPDRIPFYGEVIVARWAYEALAVFQFKENQYQQQFYELDRAMSVADFRRNYWIKSMNNKIDFIEREGITADQHKKAENAVILIQNELLRHAKLLPQLSPPQGIIKGLSQAKITHETISQLRDYLELIRQYYVKLYNTANNKKDAIISTAQSTNISKESFLQEKRDYFNENLSDLVQNNDEVDRIIEYDNHLIQKIDPIFLYPEGKFIASHFYAPAKPIFGYYYSTFWVNIIVIWVMSGFLYVAVYFRWVRKLLEISEFRQGNKKE
ncbi:ATP-binding cassette domain-containing protein [Williamwhitmania taraxaci]|uniref:ABC-type multidrug transport system, ATPase component n=1 Tax=Williamwhitmania taraxaci TaxID=1640674 RepID=A0A1G6H5M5_9BACT|nr:ATP-binding cassette domain-containing protein [Williamwhitmania taraxaci]SDB89562.1 ABC-type multidrug transport system, ATPase component [Williamwhitmania taraxaci]